jgi:glycosyltransferase involved in cell wall biosynthesis
VLNGVEQSFYEPVEPELFRGEFGIQDRFVLNVGNIEPRKNQLALIRAMKSFPERKLVLIGHQRDPEYAKACFAEGVDQVIYAGGHARSRFAGAALGLCRLRSVRPAEHAGDIGAGGACRGAQRGDFTSPR